MAVISQDTDVRYWIVTDSDANANGTFDINLKQVADFQGTAFSIHPAPRRTITRPANVAVGTIVKVTDVTTIDRTFQANPTS